jgi:hypothetical protein
MVLFQNRVRQSRSPTKMAATVMNFSGKFGSILFIGFREEDLNVKS